MDAYLDYQLNNYQKSIETEFEICPFCASKNEVTEQTYNDIDNSIVCENCENTIQLD